MTHEEAATQSDEDKSQPLPGGRVTLIASVTLAGVLAFIAGILWGSRDIGTYPESEALIACIDTYTDDDRCLQEQVDIQAAYIATARQVAKQEYDLFQANHAREVFTGQLSATRIILRLSVVITVIGILLVMLQFFMALWRGDEFDDAALEVGPDGLKLRTSFIGFLMIAFALFFWLAFLEHAYDIETVDTGSATQQEETQETDKTPEK